MAAEAETVSSLLWSVIGWMPSLPPWSAVSRESIWDPWLHSCRGRRQGRTRLQRAVSPTTTCIADSELTMVLVWTHGRANGGRECISTACCSG